MQLFFNVIHFVLHSFSLWPENSVIAEEEMHPVRN